MVKTDLQEILMEEMQKQGKTPITHQLDLTNWMRKYEPASDPGTFIANILLFYLRESECALATNTKGELFLVKYTDKAGRTDGSDIPGCVSTKNVAVEPVTLTDVSQHALRQCEKRFTSAVMDKENAKSDKENKVLDGEIWYAGNDKLALEILLENLGEKL